LNTATPVNVDLTGWELNFVGRKNWIRGQSSARGIDTAEWPTFAYLRLEKPQKSTSGKGPTMLYLVRHEETPLNAENRYRGNLNPGLTEAGKHKATGIGYRLAGKFDRIVADDFQRTQETAHRIAGGKPVEMDKGLNNWNIGDYSGQKKTPSKVKEFDSKFVAHPAAKPSNGESLNDFMARWKPKYEDYLKQSKKQNIVLVTHGSNVGAVLRGFKPAPIQDKATKATGAIVAVGHDGVPKPMAAQKSPKVALNSLVRA